jgi:hypothetical protein
MEEVRLRRSIPPATEREQELLLVLFLQDSHLLFGGRADELKEKVKERSDGQSFVDDNRQGVF